ncbi:CD3324 family protein [uncultured Robinsoniella sp.]|uniref:CD3324 family protein n=1 Tax=uncultured Robinsoniella sp. TaxID=904190 RepID=UPI00374EBF3A
MSYQNSIDLLPKELIEEIQKYIDGKVIYIPKKQSNRKQWGENTDTRQILAARNAQICQDYQNGVDVQSLSGKYFLAVKSIQRILKQVEI